MQTEGESRTAGPDPADFPRTVQNLALARDLQNSLLPPLFPFFLLTQSKTGKEYLGSKWRVLKVHTAVGIIFLKIG